VNDDAISAIQATLSGLTLRSRAIADNLSNINTPGYLATNTDFESSLKDALSGSSSSVSSMVYKSLAPTNINGNNVNLDDQTVSAMETNLRYEAMVQSLNTKFLELRTAIGQ
jgi:flagellar basal-body rod protein FlgB